MCRSASGIELQAWFLVDLEKIFNTANELMRNALLKIAIDPILSGCI